MIVRLRQCPQGAIPIRDSGIPTQLHPERFVATAERLGFKVISCQGHMYLVRLH